MLQQIGLRLQHGVQHITTGFDAKLRLPHQAAHVLYIPHATLGCSLSYCDILLHAADVTVTQKALAHLKLHILLACGLSKCCYTILFVWFLVVCPPDFLKADIPIDLILVPWLIAGVFGPGFCH